MIAIMDEIMIFNRSLSEFDIHNIYLTGLCMP